MPAITCSTWRPQPTQVGLPHRRHWIRVHMARPFSHGARTCPRGFDGAAATGVVSIHDESTRGSPAVPQGRRRLRRALGPARRSAPRRVEARARSAPDQVRRDRPEPRPHLRPDRGGGPRRRRARLASSPRRTTSPPPSRSASRRRSARADEREILEDPSLQLVVSAAIPSERAPARRARHAPRQGLHGRQAGHHHARAARRGAEGAGGDEAHLLDLLQRAAREPRHGEGGRAREGGGHRPT